MSKLFSKEQVRAWLKDNNLKEANDVEQAFMGEIKGCVAGVPGRGDDPVVGVFEV